MSLLDLYVDSATVSLDDATTYQVAKYIPSIDGNDEIVLDVLGASVDAVHDNLKALERIVANVQERIARGVSYYAPCMLRFQPTGGSYQLESEIVDAVLARKREYEVLKRPDGKRVLTDVSLKLKRRSRAGFAYFDEISSVSLASGSTVSNVGNGAIALATFRGDVPAPLVVTVTPASVTATRVALALAQSGTPANAPVILEADGSTGSYTFTRDVDAANLVDAQLSGGVGTRVTPLTTAWARRMYWTLPATNLVDSFRYIHLLCRCRDNHGSSPKTLARARVGIVSGGTIAAYGNWGALARKTLVVGGTTALPLISLGVLKLPPVDVGVQALQGIAIELHTQSANVATFDVDLCVALPCYDGGDGTGLVFASMPVSLSASARAVVDARDRRGGAYVVDGSGNVLFGKERLHGSPLLLNPSRAARLYVISYKASDETHVLGNNTVDVSVQYRHMLARGA